MNPKTHERSNFKLRAAVAGAAAGLLLLPGCSEVEQQVRDAAESAAPAADRTRKAANDLAKLVGAYCDKTYEAYQAGKIKPQPDSDKKGKLLRLPAAEQSMIQAEYDSDDNELTRKECTSNVAVYRFDSPSERDQAAAGKLSPQQVEEAAHVSVSSRPTKEGTQWRVEAENGINLPGLDEQQSEVTFTVPKDPAAKVSDELDELKYLVVGAATALGQEALQNL